MNKYRKQLSEEQIDDIVIAQAEEDTAWERPIFVRRDIPTILSLSPEIATRAAFLAQLHKTSNVEEWLRKVIEERVDFEEAAFIGLKQAMTAGSSD